MKNLHQITYFLMAFILLSCSKKVTDNVNPQQSGSLPTSPPIGHLSLSTARTGEIFEISGENFAKDSRDNIIKINGIQVSHVEVIDIEQSFGMNRKLRTCIPKNATSGEVTLTIGKNTVELGMLSIKEYISVDHWTQIADYPGTPKKQGGAATLVINNKVYVGLGFNTESGLSQEKNFNDFWEYDPAMDKWNRKADFPGGNRIFAVAFVIGNKGYIGLGGTNFSPTSLGSEKDFWEYDAATDKWTKKNDFPGGRRSISFYFVVGNRGYVGYVNSDSGRDINECWEYNSSNDSWIKRTNFPGILTNSINNLSTNIKGYLCINRKEFWEYNPVQNKWILAFEWSGAEGINYEFGFTMNNRVYVGLSYHTTPGFSQPLSYGFFEYDPVTDQSKKLTGFAGAPRNYMNAFSIGNVGYVGLCLFSKDMWAFRP